jgi:hypothetical protein
MTAGSGGVVKLEPAGVHLQDLLVSINTVHKKKRDATYLLGAVSQTPPTTD